MKIAMLGWEFPPFMAGGLGIHCLGLTRALADAGVDIDFYMPHMVVERNRAARRVSEQHSHLNIIEVASEEALNPYTGSRAYEKGFNAAVERYNARLVQEFQSHDADLLHGHDWITARAATTLRERTGKPLVWTCHSTEHDRSAGFFPQEWIAELERHACHAADAVIGVSGLTRAQLIARYGARPPDTFPVHNGVDFGKWADHQKKDYTDNGRTVLYLSRVSRQKGPTFFLEAARKVLETDGDARFVIAGKGEMLPELIDQSIRWGISDRVTFTGFIPDAEVYTLYETADVYVLPSVSEPFGISVLEAMTSGLPTIVSKTTGVGEALSHVLRAEYWDTDEMADMILRLLDSKALREELGRNGAREVRKFTWDQCGERTLGVYRHALQRAGADANPEPEPETEPDGHPAPGVEAA